LNESRYVEIGHRKTIILSSMAASLFHAGSAAGAARVVAAPTPDSMSSYAGVVRIGMEITMQQEIFNQSAKEP
jgi:hypothetical protein